MQKTQGPKDPVRSRPKGPCPLIFKNLTLISKKPYAMKKICILNILVNIEEEVYNANP